MRRAIQTLPYLESTFHLNIILPLKTLLKVVAKLNTWFSTFSNLMVEGSIRTIDSDILQIYSCLLTSVSKF